MKINKQKETSIELKMQQSDDFESWSETAESATLDISSDSSIKLLRIKLAE